MMTTIQKALCTAVLMLLASTLILATTTATIPVQGNCGMCKKTIEKAAKSVQGVSKATWNKAKKELVVVLDETKTTIIAVEKAVAAAGYDAGNETAPADAYGTLNECCLYKK
jgi:periplasmic mercuric ion binding protein